MSFQISSRLSPNQAVKRLKTYFNSRKRFDHGKKKSYEIAGTIKDKSFRFSIKNKIGSRHAFRPMLIGNVAAKDDGSMINCHFKMDRIEKILLTIWTVPLFSVTIYFAIKVYQNYLKGALATSDYYMVGIPGSMVLLTYLWIFISRFLFKDHTKLKHFILHAFQDTLN